MKMKNSVGVLSCWVCSRSVLPFGRRRRTERTTRRSASSTGATSTGAARYLKPKLAPQITDLGGHGGSHAYLTDDFHRGILLPNHKVCVDAVTALNTTIAGVYAHLSAMKGGENLKIPSVV